MALPVKRKALAEAGPRKARKVSQEPKDIDPAIGDESNKDVLSRSESEEEENGEEWGGVEAGVSAMQVEARPAGSKPVKPPTAEEMRAIREATDLYRSSSFKLQIDALLPNVRPKASRTAPLEQFLLNLHSFLSKLPSVSPQHPLAAARDLRKKGVEVAYCLPLPTEETNWKVAFERPTDIALVGSWPNKVAVKGKDDVEYGVDVAVQMPEALFQEKDYVNARFFQKRAFYLASIAKAIQGKKSGLNVDVQYESTSGDPRLTKLVLTPRPDGSSTDFTKLKARVCIIPTLPLANSPIPLHRLSPSHANLKIQSERDESPPIPQPTPVYNNTLLTAFTPKPHLLTAYNLAQSTPAFTDALTLLKVWANQRGFGKGTRMCVRGFEDAGALWVGLLDLLVSGEEAGGGGPGKKRRPLGKGLSSYQLFKSALDCLAKQDWTRGPVFVKSATGKRYDAEEYREAWPATLVDSASLVNLLASVPTGSLALLRYEASKTLETLNSASLAIDPFTEVFLQDHRDVLTRFDVILRVDLSEAKLKRPSVHGALDRGSQHLHLLFSIDSLLHKALGNRTKAISLLSPTYPSTWSLTQAHPTPPSSVVFIGLILDPEHAFGLVQHGPPAAEEGQGGEISEELKAFRELWGPKAELRRFKDGRIGESVVWDVKTADERTHVPSMVVRHILSFHFGVSSSEVELEKAGVQGWQKEWDAVVRLPKEIGSQVVQSASSSNTTIGFKGALQAFDALVKSIKALDEHPDTPLPLSLVNASPISSSLRYTSVFAPVPLSASLTQSLPPNARYAEPIEFVLEFEKSGKWPDELRAIQKIKLAFLERVAEGLMATRPGTRAAVVTAGGTGHGEEENELADRCFLEVVTPEGWAFRGRIWHDREATLLDRILDDRGPLAHIVLPKAARQQQQKGGREYADAQRAKEMYERRFIHAPRHHRAIAALAHRHGAFSGTCRLVKRWFASHWLLGSHVSEETVELLCAQFFVGDGKGLGLEEGASDEGEGAKVRENVPSAKERGFALVVRWLAEWKWEEGGIWVGLYGPPPSTEGGAGHQSAAIGAGTSTSVASRGTGAGPSAAWILQTAMDKDGKMWTKGGPDVIVAKRIRAVAGATCGFMRGIENIHGTFDIKGMFTHPTQDYDFIVHLDPAVLPRYVHNVHADPALLSKGKYANAGLGEAGVEIVPGFDPARAFFDDLQRTYADTFRLFFDCYGGTQFGGVWDPTLKTSRPFRVLGGYSSKPMSKENDKEKDKGLVVLNEAAVLEEIERMGSGLVKKVTRRK
ncbi:pre-rRNA processing protein Utp22 [Coprinopsis sp. MPI-PUGE-AT-0042]|nr:pre-rRNA processing protein Utp22 [Coprinopsis sp. MPI-PUGE-AT-0042]